MENLREWNPRESIAKVAGGVDTLEKLEPMFSEEQKKTIVAAIEKLDKEFIVDKVEVIRDTMMEVQRNRKTTPNTLLQRNIWSSFDALALHFDYTGFTNSFQEIVPRYFEKDFHLDDPAIVSVEWQMMLDFLGIDENEAAELDMPFSEITEVMKFAEEEKLGDHGLSYITGPEFSFQKFFSEACGRPDQILEIHHSPQSKATVAVIIGVIDIIAVFEIPILTVVTVIVLLIVLGAGC